MIKAKLIAVVAASALLFGAGWSANGWRLSGQHAKELADRDRDALTMANQVMAIGKAANNVISAADAAAWKALEDDKQELNRLRACVANRTCGVRIITKPANTGSSASSASSLEHDSVALDSDVQRRVLDLREAIGEDARKLEYLQAYALQCWKATNAEAIKPE